MSGDENRETAADSERRGDEMSEGEIDCNLIETFPASDPPSWTLGTDHKRESPPSRAPERPAPNEGE